MSLSSFDRRFLTQEAESLLARLDRVHPLALVMPMVPAAALPDGALRLVDGFLRRGRRDLRGRVGGFLASIASAHEALSPSQAQRRFAFLKLRFNAVLAEFDIFADVLTQRGEGSFGVWLAGLDSAAADALAVPGLPVDPPQLVTYLDRGHGAAIRRARTRLPGGGENPVAVVRVPRERMIGSGVASSLVHEVGHQGAALLSLVESLRRDLLVQTRRLPPARRSAWRLWERWISEIVADLWSVARLGVAATHGLMGVVSLPRAFVFRVQIDDPHPFPWIRVRLSCAVGRALYPDPQWRKLDRVWQALYPVAGLDPQRRRIIRELETSLPRFVERLLDHRPPSLEGRTLASLLASPSRGAAALRLRFDQWRVTPRRRPETPPTLAMAVLGQAKLDGRITARDESRVLADLLTRWALRRARTAPRAATCACRRVA